MENVAHVFYVGCRLMKKDIADRDDAKLTGFRLTG